jgi:hypothetical protein
MKESGSVQINTELDPGDSKTFESYGYRSRTLLPTKHIVPKDFPHRINTYELE